MDENPADQVNSDLRLADDMAGFQLDGKLDPQF